MAAGRKPHKYRRGRGRLGKIIQVLFLAAVLAAVTVGATVFFQVEEIWVTGNQRYSQEELIAATGIQMGDNLFHMNKFAIQDQVKEAMPYVEDILIRRKLPNAITVTVQEWDAVAQITPNENWVPPEPEKDENGEVIDSDQHIPEATRQTWLISVGGKLLEEAPADSARMVVTGLTGLDARAGIQLEVPEEEQTKLEGLLALLAELEDRGMIGDVSRVELGSLSIVLEYLGRYDVKLPLNGDFSYKLESLLAAVEDRESAMGGDITGTFDLTQKNYTAVYSPQRLK